MINTIEVIMIITGVILLIVAKFAIAERDAEIFELKNQLYTQANQGFNSQYIPLYASKEVSRHELYCKEGNVDAYKNALKEDLLENIDDYIKYKTNECNGLLRQNIEITATLDIYQPRLTKPFMYGLSKGK